MAHTNIIDHCVVRVRSASNQARFCDVTVAMVNNFSPDGAPLFGIADDNYVYTFRIYQTNNVIIQVQTRPINNNSDTSTGHSAAGIHFFRTYPTAFLLPTIGWVWHLDAGVLTTEAFPFEVLEDFSGSV